MFGTVDVKTRPLRLAYLVDPNSRVQVREAIRLSSSLWGGAYFPIIPLNKRMPATWRDKPLKAPSAKAVILGYLEAFDPDILIQFSREVSSFVTDMGLRIIKPEEVWSVLDEGQSLSPKFGIGIFEVLNDVYDKYFKYTPKYPARVILPKIPLARSLFWASWLGELPAKVASQVKERFSEPLNIETPKFTAEQLSNTMAGNVFFPRRLAQYGLNLHSRRSRLRGGAAVYFLDATKVEDIVDFWNLRALGRSVLPLPKQLKDDPQLREIVMNFLRDQRRHWRHNPKVCDYAHFIRARNCTFEEMQDYAQSLDIERDSSDPSDAPFFALQHRYPRVWDEWAREKDGAPVDMYGDVEESIEIKEPQVRFKELLPAFAFEQSFHSEPRCANEIGFQFFGTDQHLAEVFPKGSGQNLVRAISGFTSFREWRVGRNGLVKLVEHGFSETRDIPAAESIFFAWLADRGWKPQLSPPGLLAKEIYKRLQGNPSILRNETLLGLLERMNGGKVKQEIDAIEVEQERELPVGAVKGRLEGSSEGGNPHDYLISRGVFKLGIRVQCPHCLRHSWFSLESLRDTLTCPKCLNSYLAIGNVGAPEWSYKTVGPFSVPRYAEGAYAVLLTLEFIGGRRTSTTRTTPVLSFKAEAPSKKDIEADVAMFWQESVFGESVDGLLFGECKSYGVFKERDFDRMRYLAETFPGAVLVFSTLRQSLTASEVKGIKRIAKAGRKYWKPERSINPVLILTGTELFNRSRPPHCWEQSLQQRFSRMYGLLDICDATQQIYLGLPSWATERHEKWEKRRQRQQAGRVAS